jgi:hypothetical protein
MTSEACGSAFALPLVGVVFLLGSPDAEETGTRFHEEEVLVRSDRNCVWAWLSAEVQESRSLH